MKKFISVFFVIFTVLCSLLCCITVGAEESSYIYVESLNDGVYNIDVKSSSSMFKIVDCKLNVSNGEMSAVMTLSGKGYEKLFMGKAEQALLSSENDYIYFAENSDGKYTYTVPVEALDMEIDCSAWSFKKEKWYDRVLVFQSDKLPKEAYVQSFNVLFVVIASALVLVVTVAVILILRKKKNKKGF